MRSIVALMSLLLVAAGCSAQQVIPIRLRRGMPYVRAVIDGKPVIAVVDTGTGGIAVDKGFAETAGLHVGRSLGQALGGGTGDPEVSALQLRSVRVGSIRLHNVSAVAVDLSPLFADTGVPFAALLGYPLFAHHVITIDYPQREMVVRPRADAPTCKAPVRIAGFLDETPIVAARVRFPGSNRSYTAHLIVDTGTTGGAAVVLGGKFLHVEPARRIMRGEPTSEGNGIGGSLAAWHGTLAELKLGSLRFRHVPVALTRGISAFNTGRASGTLGIGLWERGSITLDYAHRWLCIDVPDEGAARAGRAVTPGA